MENESDQFGEEEAVRIAEGIIDRGHYFPGEKPATREQLVAAIVGALKEVATAPQVLVPVDQIEEMYERFKRLTRMGQATIEEWRAMPEAEAKLRRAIFAEAEWGCLLAGNWVSKEGRAKVRARLLIPRSET